MYNNMSLGLSLQLQFENNNSKSNIVTVFRIEAYIRYCIKMTILHLVCMSISRLSNDFYNKSATTA